MAEIRRGTAMLLTAGDKEISTALANGILAVRLPMMNSLSQPTADSSLGEGNSISHAARASSLWDGALTKEQREAVSAEIDRQRIEEALRKELHPVPVDYAGLAYDAEVSYGESLYEPGALGKVGRALLVGYAMVVMGFHELFESLGL